MRRVVLLLLAMTAVVIAWYLRPRDGQRLKSDPPAASVSSPESPARTSRTDARNPPAPATGGSGSGNAGELTVPTAGWNASDFPIAASLNAPESTIRQDLEIVSQLFDAWRSNFPLDGNPVGENAEITAALMGDNRLGLALIPKGHRAVNEKGELCDRWGTPFRFHQLSGTQMEIRSAGPDRKFRTADDAGWAPH